MIRSIITLNIDILIIALGHMCKVAQLKLTFLYIGYETDNTGWLKSFESDTYNQIEESKFIRYFNISSSI